MKKMMTAALYVLLCAALYVLLCAALTGCETLPYPRELEDTMLVRVLGVDWTAEEVVLTAASIPEEGEEDERLLAVRASDAKESHRKLKEAGEEYVALTHVTQIVVGEGSDLRAVLEGALEGREVGQTATVWLCREGTALELMEAVEGGARRLTSIELNTRGLTAMTVLDALAELERTHQAALPALAAEKGRLEWVGTKLWKEEQR